MTASEIEEIADVLRRHWSFDAGQMHTHSWHDREDFIADVLPKLLADAEARGARRADDAFRSACEAMGLPQARRGRGGRVVSSADRARTAAAFSEWWSGRGTLKEHAAALGISYGAVSARFYALRKSVGPRAAPGGEETNG